MDAVLLQQYVSEGYTRQEIAGMMDIPLSTVSNYCTKHGIKTRRPSMVGKRTKYDAQEVIGFRREGLSYSQISEKTGASKHAVVDICKRYDLGGKLADWRLHEEQVADYVSKAGFVYVGGYQTSKHPITVRCNDCGQTFERQAHIFFEAARGMWVYKNECPICRKERQRQERKKRELEQKELREQKEREAQMKAQHRAEQLSRQVNDQLIKRLANHVCKNCGTEYCIELTGYDSDAYCSKRCQQRWHDRIKNDRRMDRLKARPHDTDITLEKLFKRDGGVCYICGCQCDWDDIVDKDGAMVAGDSYPSIDHVKPVAKGGTHTWSNIKLACRGCNMKKGWK